MSDLTGKFGSFEDQIASNHTEIMNALDTIAMALGAPPPGPTTTLADVVVALTQTNLILNGIRTDMNDQLTAIFNTVDAINNNASLNAQRLISVLLQTACPCDDTAPILPPDLGTTPIDATDIAKCQRIQYFIDLYRSWGVNVAAAIGGAGSISSFQINNLLQLTLGDVGISTGQLKSGMPTSTRDGLVGQISSAIGASSAAAINTGLFTAITTSSNLEALRQALYGVANASAGKAAADSAIDGLGLDPLIAGILKSMFYSAWPNDIYGAVPVVDASAYDGSICAPVTANCWDFSSVDDEEHHLPSDSRHTYPSVEWPNTTDLPATNVNPDGTVVSNHTIWLLQDCYGWTVTQHTGHITVTDGVLGNLGYTTGEWTITQHTTYLAIISFEGPFTVTVCRPAGM